MLPGNGKQGGLRDYGRVFDETNPHNPIMLFQQVQDHPAGAEPGNHHFVEMIDGFIAKVNNPQSPG